MLDCDHICVSVHFVIPEEVWYILTNKNKPEEFVVNLSFFLIFLRF